MGDQLQICTTNAKSASRSLLLGDLVSALESLSITHDGGLLLEKKLNSYLQRLEDLEMHNKALQEKYYADIQRYKNEESRLRNEIDSKNREISDKNAAISVVIGYRNEAERSYDRARRERDEAQEKYDRARSFWWVPVAGWIWGLQELIEDNEGLARRAKNRMNQYQEEIDEHSQDLKRYESQLSSLTYSLQCNQSYLQNCKRKQDEVNSKISNICEAIADVANRHKETLERVCKPGPEGKHQNYPYAKFGHMWSAETVTLSQECWHEAMYQHV